MARSRWWWKLQIAEGETDYNTTRLGATLLFTLARCGCQSIKVSASSEPQPHSLLYYTPACAVIIADTRADDKRHNWQMKMGQKFNLLYGINPFFSGSRKQTYTWTWLQPMAQCWAAWPYFFQREIQRKLVSTTFKHKQKVQSCPPLLPRFSNMCWWQSHVLAARAEEKGPLIFI